MMDAHKILGVPKNATADQIKQAYRRKSAKYHPDRGGDAWAHGQQDQSILAKAFRGEFVPQDPRDEPAS